MDLAELDSMLNDPVAYALRRRRQATAGMPTDAYDSLLADLTDAPLSALEWLGSTLDKPGRAVRGLLGGRPEELANLIPFSDTLGITDSDGLLGGTPLQISDRENALSGRDLLREYGLAGDTDNWGNFAAGLGVEMLTDPLTYLTLGTGAALTKGGQLAAKAGVLPARAVGSIDDVGRLTGSLGKVAPKLGAHLDEATRMASNPWVSNVGLDSLTRTAATTAGDDVSLKLLNAAQGSGLGVDDLLRIKDEPLAALAKYGIGDNAAMLGLGDAGAEVGKYLDSASDWWKQSIPGRMTNKLFDRRAGNRMTAVGQTAARGMYAALDAEAPTLHRAAGDVVQQLQASGLKPEQWDQIGAYVGEKQWPDNKLTLPEREALAAGMSQAGTPLAPGQVIGDINGQTFQVPGYQFRAFDYAGEAVGSDRSVSDSLGSWGWGPFAIQVRNSGAQPIAHHPGAARGAVDPKDVARIFVKMDEIVPESQPEYFLQHLSALRKQFPDAEVVQLKSQGDNVVVDSVGNTKRKTLRELAFEETLKARGVDPATVNYKPVAAAMDALEQEGWRIREKAWEYGLHEQAGLADEYSAWMHRQLDLENKPVSGGYKQFPVFGAQDIQRADFLRDIPAGTGKLDDLANDVALRDLLQKETTFYNLADKATDAQTNKLQQMKFDPNSVNDLKRWQAQRIIAQLESGIAPDQVVKTFMTPNVAPRPPREGIERIMQAIDTKADMSSLPRLREIQQMIKEGPSLGDYFRALPPDTPISEAVYKAFNEGGQALIPSEVDEIFAAEGWEGIANALEEISVDATRTLRDEIGLKGGKGMLPEELQEEYQSLLDMWNQSKKIATWFATNPGKWSKNVIDNNMQAHLSDLRKVSGMEAVMRQIGRVVEPLPTDPAESERLLNALRTPLPTPTQTFGPAGVPPIAAPDALTQAVNALFVHKRTVPDGKVRVVDAIAQMGPPTSIEARARTITKLAEHLAASGVFPPNIVEAIKAGDANAIIALDNLVVPADVAKDISSFVGGMNLSREMGPIITAFDQITNTLKGHLTSVWPAFAARNGWSLLWQDGVTGGFAAPQQMVTGWKNSMSLLRGGEITGASRWPMFAGQNLTDAEATRQLSLMSYALGVTPRVHAATETIGKALPGGTIAQNLPAGQFAGKGPLAGYARGKDWYNPLAVRGGLGGRESSDFILSKGGEHLNSFIESLGRNATFLRKVAEGYAPEQAAILSKAAHVDFADLSVFEREVMKRVAPFYNYTRHAAPWNLREIAERPGGVVAQSVRATSGNEAEFTPEQAVGGIPIGNEANGTQRYLNLDLPVNVLNDVFGAGRGITGTLSETGYRGLSMLHPAIKAPLELITGQSFFQRGRPLTDLYSRTGTGTLGDQLLMNSPASRYITTGSMLADPRKDLLTKGANLLGGVRFSDVNIDQARERAGARAAAELLREGGAKTFERVYFPEGYNPTPDEAQLMALLQAQAQRRRAQPIAR